MEAHSDLPPVMTQPDVQISDAVVENTAAQFNNNPPYDEQSRVNQAVDVILSYLDPEVAPVAVGMLQELQEISLIDMIGPPFSRGPGAAVTGPCVAPSDDQGGQGSDPFAPLSVQQSAQYLN